LWTAIAITFVHHYTLATTVIHSAYLVHSAYLRLSLRPPSPHLDYPYNHIMVAHPSGTTTAEHNARLEAVATSLEDLARNLRALKLAPEGSAPRSFSADAPSAPPPPAQPAPPTPSANFYVGQRVRVLVAGPHRGRTGEILSRRGRIFWNLQLDATSHQPQCLIWKLPSSLQALPAGL
jgi:hypothetical protein